MTFVSLASSSAGNAYLVSDGETTILLECGLTMPKLKKATGFKLSEVAACFITHEHADHSHAAKLLYRAGIPVFMSEGTAKALDFSDAELVEYNQATEIGALRILPFRVWHDAAEPVGYLIEDHKTKERLLFAADTRSMNLVVKGLTFIAIECNYDDAILGQSQRINPKLRERIRHTHMEINDVIRYLHKLDLSGCLRIFLLHLSDSHSREAEWMKRFQNEFPDIQITICAK